LRVRKLVAAAAQLKRTSGWADPLFSLAFMTDHERIPNPDSLLNALPQGTAVIFRDYDVPDRTSLAQKLCTSARAKGLLFFVAADIKIARDVGADGVHIPGFLNSAERRLLVKGANMTGHELTFACHSWSDIQFANEIGVAAAFLSPAFATRSHPGASSLGAAKFKTLARQASRPIVALGGVKAHNAWQLSAKNVVGLAAIDAFVQG